MGDRSGERVMKPRQMRSLLAAMVARVDIGAIFADGLIRHEVRYEDVPEDVSVGSPDVLLMVDDRTVGPHAGVRADAAAGLFVWLRFASCSDLSLRLLKHCRKRISSGRQLPKGIGNVHLSFMDRLALSFAVSLQRTEFFEIEMTAGRAKP